MLDELDLLINKFIDKFVLPLPLYMFHLPYIVARRVQGFGLAIRVWFHRPQTNQIQQCQTDIDAELRALGLEPDDDRTS
jgi:hypothetical protein